MVGMVGSERSSRSIATATVIGKGEEKIPSLRDYESTQLLGRGRSEAPMNEKVMRTATSRHSIPHGVFILHNVEGSLEQPMTPRRGITHGVFIPYFTFDLSKYAYVYANALFP